MIRTTKTCQGGVFSVTLLFVKDDHILNALKMVREGKVPADKVNGVIFNLLKDAKDTIIEWVKKTQVKEGEKPVLEKEIEATNSNI